jgi:NAD(P)H-dependent FMN reductase
VAAGAVVDDFERLAEIPPFDADRSAELIDVIEEWRHRVRTADIILVATPEYAGAVAGAVKNAFDWLVGSGELYRKPVAVLSAGTTGGYHARRMMAQTLTWQGAYVLAEVGVASAGTKFDAGRLRDEPTEAAIRLLIETLLASPTMSVTEVVERATSLVGSLGIDTAHVTPAA